MMIRKILIVAAIAMACLDLSAVARKNQNAKTKPVNFVVDGIEQEINAVDLGKLADDKAVKKDPISMACQLIKQGNFDEAKKTLVTVEKKIQRRQRLEKIIDDYQRLERRRKQAKTKAYQDKLQLLEKIEEAYKIADFNDVNDVDDTNDTAGIFLVITRACEYAQVENKKDVLDKKFVKKFIKERKQAAKKQEKQGKWLKSYLGCYSWLQAIDPNDKLYEEYAKELLEKAAIESSFSDSPCETSVERFDGVTTKIFTRAIDALDNGYVAIIDYKKMATDVIDKVILLQEVMSVTYENLEAEDVNDAMWKDFAPPTDKQKKAFLAGLKKITETLDDDKFSGIDKKYFLKLFQNVLELNQVTAKLPQEILISQCAEAALKTLDPHTTIIWPRQVEDFDKLMTSEFSGVGIEISKKTGQLTVMSLLPDTPAYNSGIDAGDIIEAVNGVETEDMTIYCAVKNITGEKGTPVTLTIKNPETKKTKDVVIVRDRIVVPTIRGWQRTVKGNWKYMIDQENKIGYIRVTSFAEKTTRDFEKVLNRLEKEQMKGLIIDLRDNSGGLLTCAIEICDNFLTEGLIVSTRPKYGVWTYAAANKKGTRGYMPIVILVNSHSASASEIVSGALSDKRYERAVVVGQRTYGKGSVQGITGYPKGGAQMKYTMAYYHLPSGQRVESKAEMKEKNRTDWGVTPNVEVKLRSDELKEKYEIQKDNDVLVKADHDNGAKPIEKHSLDKTIKSDKQMAVGLLVMKAMLIENQAN